MRLAPPFGRRLKRDHRDAPMLKLLSQHDRGSNFNDPPCVAPEYPQQWTTYIKAEDAGWVSEFALTESGIKRLNDLKTLLNT